MTTLRILAGTLAATAVLAGCETSSQTIPTHRLNPAVVAESVERLELYSRPNGLSLSARDRSAVAQFVSDYARAGAGPIHINRPAGFGNGLGVQETDQLLRLVMAEVGVDPRAAQTGEYYVRPGDPSPVVVSYKALRTVPQDCGMLQSITSAGGTGVRPGFGCFASANLAAMIDDPRQLLGPLPAGTPNAQRRQVIYDKYIKGEETGAVRPEEQKINSQRSRS